MELIRDFTEDIYQRALEDWTWLEPVSRLTPRFTNAFGDIFLEDRDGTMWFLDTLNGTVESTAPNAPTLQAQLADAAVRERLLMASLAQSAHEAGLTPGPTSILSFATPPALGGPLTVDNLEVSDFEVTLSFAGQIHRQIQGTSPGQPVSGVKSFPTETATSARKHKGLFRRLGK
jgi:hypothetical protein